MHAAIHTLVQDRQLSFLRQAATALPRRSAGPSRHFLPADSSERRSRQQRAGSGPPVSPGQSRSPIALRDHQMRPVRP
jgi:hypothetical protein